MPLRTNVGISRKIADNNYGSRGASVNLEVELDSSLVQEPERLQERIRHVFRLAQQSVDEELARQQNPQPSDNGQSRAESPTQFGPAAESRPQNGNDQRNGSGRMAGEKQLTYARQLAGQVKGLGVRKLESLAQRMFNKPLAALSSLDASGLIDVLKQVKAGTIDIDSVLNGAAT
jgi:hypothetical protein